MKSLKQIREASGGKEAYQKFFNSLLKKFGVKSPAELDDAKKKEFYDKANSLGQEEVTKFAKELIKKQSNT